MKSSTLGAFLAFCFFFTVAVCSTTTHCTFEPLPKSFNTLGYLDFNQEFHIHGEYLVDFTKFSQTITFNLTTKSSCRFTVAPQEVDIDLWLYNDKGFSMHSSLAIGTEEVISQDLEAGNYRFRLVYLALGSGIHISDCPTILFEAAIVPVDRLTSRILKYNCPTSSVFPPVSVGDLISSSLAGSDGEFAGTGTYVWIPSGSQGVIWLANVTFTIPSSTTNSLYQLETTIGYDFITGSSLGLMIQTGDHPAQLTPVQCSTANGCWVGSNYRYNQHVLMTNLPPGNYTVWLFEVTSERSSHITCNPFSLSLEIVPISQDENLLTCPYLPPPSSLNTPGFLDHAGNLFFLEDILISTSLDIIKFQVSVSSSLRVYVTHTQFDVDIYLANSTGDVITSAIRYGADGLTFKVEPGQEYIIAVSMGAYHPDSFCQTYRLEIAISPLPDVNLYASKCTTQNLLPDLSALTASGNVPDSFQLTDDAVYSYNNNGNPLPRDGGIYNITFSVLNKSVIFYAELEFNFLWGDMTMSLESPSLNPDYYGAEVHRNRMEMGALLTNGTYTFSINFAPVQPASTPFANCGLFNLELFIIQNFELPECLLAHELPETLDTVEYFGSSNWIHIQNDFFLPEFSSRYAEQEITFTPPDDSYLRIFIQVYSLSMEVYLYNSSSLVSEHSAQTFGKLFEKVKKGEHYSLVFRYYRPDFDTSCSTYNLEMAIEPVSSNQPECQQPTNLPTADQLPINGNFSKVYYYEQTGSNPLNYSIPLRFTKEKVLAVLLNYNFLLYDLYLQLTDSSGQTLGYGVNGYNSNLLGPVVVPVGSYNLTIAETIRTPEEIQGCISFLFTIEIQDHKTNYTEEELALECKTSPIPDQLNIPGYLSNISGQILHFAQPILITPGAIDYSRFQVFEDALFRLHVPAIPDIDVDIALWDSNNSQVDYRVSTGEETMWLQLSKGEYYLEFHYYAGKLSSDDCVSFPLQLAIEPLSYVQTLDQATTSCVSSTVPSQLQGNVSFHGEYKFSFVGTQAGFSRSLSFAIQKAGHLDIDVGFDFATAGLSARLVGVSTSNVSSQWTGVVGVNHIFIGEDLQAGNYTLTVYTPAINTPPVNWIKCGLFSLDYFLNVTSNQGPTCDSLPFPTDLYTPAGGSQPYGGPQDPVDSSIRLFSKQFEIPTVPRSSYFLMFQVKVASYLRFFSYSPIADIDFYIYKDVNRSTIMGSSLSFDSTESRLFSLPPQTMDYMFELRFVTVPTTHCNLFHFEMAIESTQSVSNELLCPNPLPVPELPPPSIVVPSGLFEFGSSDYVLSKERIGNNTYSYDYQISLQINSVPAAFYAEVGFDFIPNSFELFLTPPTSSNSSGEVIQGTFDGTEDRTGEINFINSIDMQIFRPGLYILTLSEDLWSQRSIFSSMQNYCHHFSFSLAITSQIGPSVPEVLRVAPPEADNLDPGQELRIIIFLSTAPSSPSVSDLANVTGNFTYLVDLSNQIRIPPTSVRYGYLNQSVVITYAPNSLSLSKSYRLVFYPEKFKDANGTSFVMTETSDHIYMMKNCDCNGHGTCVSSSNKISCTCRTGYVGSLCEACADGYHGVGSDCVANVNCTPNYCNGHGNCSQIQGVPHCDCDQGWATINDQFCTTCAYGYIFKNDQCVQDDEDGGSQATCTAPLLPKNLNTPAYLNYNQTVDLSGFYYIDVKHRRDDINFALVQDSLIRIYVEPHVVDIDLWLGIVDSTGRVQNINHQLSLGGEESIFMYLDGSSTKPIQYQLTLRYYLWGPLVVSNCETANFQLSISPVSVIAQDQLKIQQLCTKTNSLPSLLQNQTISGTPFVYQSSSPLYQSSSCPVSTSSGTNDPCQTNLYFYSWNFTVEKVDYKVPVILASIEYHFLPSDFGLVLEIGQGMQCPKKYNSTICFFGQNEYNKNELKMDLQPGVYTLHIYQPKPQMNNVTTCGIFDLSVSIGYVTVEEDYWDCVASDLPETFNSPGYLDNEGFMHRQDSYFLGRTVDIDFSITSASVIRVSIFSSNIFFIWALSNDSHVFFFHYSANQKNGYTKNSMFSTIPPGNYNLTIIPQLDTQSLDGRVFCPTALIEMAIQPSGFQRTCPSNNRDILPALPETIRAPFYYQNESLLLFANDEASFQIASYNIVVDQLSSLTAIITDDFVSGDLTLELYTASNQRISSALTRYNENAFYTLLEPGTYFLQLSQSSQWEQSLSPCIPFSFHLELNQTVSANSCFDKIEDAISVYPETLPTTFDTVRFLKSSTKIHFAGSFWIPSMDYYVNKNITLTPAVPSLFRIFFEPHEIDIDIKLSTQDGQTIAQGANGWNSEEELIETLDANQTYVLTITYYNWHSISLNCLSHDVEFAIAPLASTGLDQDCPQAGKDHWPTSIPQNPTLPFVYDSLGSKESLYYQQTTTDIKRKDYVLVLSKTTDLYASLSFDFLTSHLALQLSQEGTASVHGSTPYTASETYLDRSVIAVRGLMAGTYNLSIVELYPSEEEVTGCAFFSMILLLQDYGYDQGIETSILNPSIPGTFDSLSYLKYSDRLHIQEPYIAFHGTHRETIQFTVDVDSVARVYIDNPYVSDPEVKYILTILASGQQYYSGQGTVISTLTPGVWYLSLQLVYNDGWTGDLDKDVIVNTEVALAPLATLKEDIKTWPRSCTVSKLDDIHLNPDGYFQDSKTLTGQAVSGSGSSTLQRVNFVLEQESLFYISIGYNFLLYDIDLQLQNSDATVRVAGSTRRNSEDIDVLLKPGNYTFTLLYSSSNSLSSLGNFCFDYTYNVQIQASSGTHSSCTQNDLIPWDLNDPSGGSAPFGGPVNSRGQLYLTGSSFNLIEGKLIDYINVTVSKSSVLSVFTSVNTGSSYLGISTTVNNLTPVYSLATRLEGWKVFRLNAQTTPLKYTISLDRLVSTDRASCPSFEMAIALDTIDSIERQLLCPQSIYSRLPSSIVTFSANGLASEHIESILPNDYSFPNVTFELKEASMFIASMEFNPLSFDIEMDLFHLDSSGNMIKVRTGEIKGDEDDSSTSLTHLAYEVTQLNLYKGNYTLVIRSRSFVPTLFGEDWQTTIFKGREVCYPFVWDLNILPVLNYPYIVEVDPEDATDIFFGERTNWDISIRFSTQPYTRDMVPITASSGNAIKQAFYLSGGGSPLYPDLVEPDEGGLDWKLVWSVSRMKTGVTYTLKLVATRIYNASQIEFSLPGIHTYSTADTSCNGHGTFKNGSCSCSDGYVGKECDVCDLGYQSQKTTEGVITHCVPVGSADLCKPDSCGCLPVDGNKCEMIGLCDDSSGKVVCSCPSQYAGSHCEKCASGFTGYPRCVFANHCPASCGHGECQVSTGTCACFSGWAGTQCDGCAPGFSGSECSNYNPDDGSNSDSGWDSTLRVMIIAGIVILVVILLGFAAYYVWKRRSSPYHRLNRNLFDDEELAEAHTLEDFNSNQN